MSKIRKATAVVLLILFLPILWFGYYQAFGCHVNYHYEPYNCGFPFVTETVYQRFPLSNGLRLREPPAEVTRREHKPLGVAGNILVWLIPVALWVVVFRRVGRQDP